MSTIAEGKRALERNAVIHIRDRVARGRAIKEFLVKTQPYLGPPLHEFVTLPVPGYEEARLEFYSVSPEEERSGRVCLCCGGATVLDDHSLIEGMDAPRLPWASGLIEGAIDFPEPQVAPGTRRGFVPNAASQAFLEALPALERELGERIDEENRRRADPPLRQGAGATQLRQGGRRRTAGAHGRAADLPRHRQPAVGLLSFGRAPITTFLSGTFKI